MKNSLIKWIGDNAWKSLGIILLVWLLTPILVYIHHEIGHAFFSKQEMTHDEFGTFGDTFGYTNSLLSALALIMVIISVSIQQEELSAFKNTFQKDSFERTFFNMINLFNDQRSTLEVGNTTGSEVIQRAVLGCYRNVTMDDIRGYYQDSLDHDRTYFCLKDYLFSKQFDKEDVEYNDGQRITNEQPYPLYFYEKLGDLDDKYTPLLYDLVLTGAGINLIAKRYSQIVMNTFDFIFVEVSNMYDPVDFPTEHSNEMGKYSKLFFNQLTDAEIEFILIHAYAFMRMKTDFHYERLFEHLQQHCIISGLNEVIKTEYPYLFPEAEV